MNFSELLVGIGLFLVGVTLGSHHALSTLPEPKPAPITFSVEGAGICKVAGGGKTWLLVDMTKEFLVPEDVEEVTEENLK